MKEHEHPIPEPRRYGPKTPMIAINLLRVLSDYEEGRSAQALARQCDLHPASAYRHLDSLWQLGLVRLEGDHYRIDPRARLLGSKPDHKAIDKVLGEFVEATGRDVALATLHDGRLVVTHLHCDSEARSLLADVPPNALHATAAGKALLSALSPTDRRYLLEEIGMPPFTEKTITNPDEFEARLHHDGHGIWSAEGEYCEVGGCLAALADSGRLFSECIAITTSVLIAELDDVREQLTAALHRAVVLLKPVLGPLMPPEGAAA